MHRHTKRARVGALEIEIVAEMGGDAPFCRLNLSFTAMCMEEMGFYLQTFKTAQALTSRQVAYACEGLHASAVFEIELGGDMAATKERMAHVLSILNGPTINERHKTKKKKPCGCGGS